MPSGAFNSESLEEGRVRCLRGRLPRCDASASERGLDQVRFSSVPNLIIAALFLVGATLASLASRRYFCTPTGLVPQPKLVPL
jgi:hypothetical protein